MICICGKLPRSSVIQIWRTFMHITALIIHWLVQILGCRYLVLTPLSPHSLFLSLMLTSVSFLPVHLPFGPRYRLEHPPTRFVCSSGGTYTADSHCYCVCCVFAPNTIVPGRCCVTWRHCGFRCHDHGARSKDNQLRNVVWCSVTSGDFKVSNAPCFTFI
jgi:hypothetical protein